MRNNENICCDTLTCHNSHIYKTLPLLRPYEMKKRKAPQQEMDPSKVKAVEYCIPFLPPCDACGRSDETGLRDHPTWEWQNLSDVPSAEEQTGYAPETGKTRPVPIVDARSPDACERYRQAILAGEPIVLTGPKTHCLTEFSSPWFKNGVFDVQQFCNSVGTAVGPLARDGYTGSQLESGESMMISEYMTKYWPFSRKKENYPYLAQWQFGAEIIDNDNPEEDFQDQGLKSLHWRLSTVPVDVVGTDFFSINGVNPYQYLFIGGSGTSSKIHNDLGGMTIFLIGMVGEKSVTLIHRDDEHMLYGMEARKNGLMEEADFSKKPLSYLSRTWHHIVLPGDVLVMPPRTIHAVENLTACISYSRCHIGPYEMGEWLRSRIVFDTPSMNHEVVVHEAATYFIRCCSNKEPNSLTSDEKSCVESLRDACRVLASQVSNNNEAAVGAWMLLGDELDSLLPSEVRRCVVKATVEIESGSVRVESNKMKKVITPGDVVSLKPGVALGKRLGRRALVIRVHKQIFLVRVKYSKEFPGTELIPLKRIRVRGTNSSSKPFKGKKIQESTPNDYHQSLIKGAPVVISWPTGETFNAVLVENVPETPCDALEIQYHKLGFV